MTKHGGEADSPASDLTAEAKSRILLEETYRSEVRRQLDQGDPRRRRRVIAFFNTALGLWLLSTLVVSVLGTAYSNAKEKWDRDRVLAQEFRQRAREREDQIDRLDLEISFRLSGLISYLHQRHRGQTGQPGAEPDRAAVSIQQLEQIVQLPPQEAARQGYPVSSLYHAHRSQALPSLLAELSRLTRQELAANSVNPVDQSLSRLTAIPMLFERKGLETPANARRIASAIQEEVFLPRWRRNSFAFTDCSAGEPFC